VRNHKNSPFSSGGAALQSLADVLKGKARRGASGGQGLCPTAPGASPTPPLGIYAKTASATSNPTPITWALVHDGDGEVVPLEGDFPRQKPVVDSRQARAERFALKSVVNGIMPTSRTSKCMRWRVPKQQVEVWKSAEHKKAHYKGVQMCASVWCCPVCSAKISERRRAELKGAVATAKAMGWQVLMLTLTVPHALGDDLDDMLDRMMAAWRYCSSSRMGQAARAAIDLRGTIRALEVTHGQNGWHPHFHVLLFVPGNVTVQRVQDEFTPLWLHACELRGLPRPSALRGVQVQDGSYAESYVGKWGLESEMTKGHSKQGKNGGRTPFDLLRGILSDKSDKRSVALFLAFAEAFKGRRQLYWSQGLKEALGVADLADDELVEVDDDESTLLAQLTDEQWRAVKATRNEASLLTVAELHPDSVQFFLESVVRMAPAKLGDDCHPDG
jgi:hypothetical protein